MTNEEWQEWKTRKPTREYLKLLNEAIDDIQEGLGNGNCLNTESVDNTAMVYSKGVGTIKGLNRAITIIDELTVEEE